MKIFFILILLIITSCAHKPKCGNPEGANIIYTGSNTCLMRIRQVEIGSELKIPDSLKNPELVLFQMSWADPVYINGAITMGHFRLIPQELRSKEVNSVSENKNVVLHE